MDDKLAEKKTKRNFRRNKDEDSSEDETQIVRKIAKIEEKPINDEDAKNKMLDEDLEERNAFVTRLLERDEMKTKKADQGGLSAAQIEQLATKGVLAADTNDKSTIDQLREISRQHYLEKREKKELELLNLSIKDEEFLFEGVEITKEEKKRMELNRKILNMAKDRYRFEYKDDGYHIPDAYDNPDGTINKEKREAVLTTR